MYRFIQSGELQPSAGGTVTFEGEGYGSAVSFFLINNQPGAGPDLHRHPYSETWIVRAGKARLDIICIHASPRMIQESLEDGPSVGL